MLYWLRNYWLSEYIDCAYQRLVTNISVTDIFLVHLLKVTLPQNDNNMLNNVTK